MLSTTIAAALAAAISLFALGCGDVQAPAAPEPEAQAKASGPDTDVASESTEPLDQETTESPANPPDITVLKPEQIRAKMDEAKGTIVVANFWATWCPPCVKETPNLIKFYNEHHGDGVTFLSLSVDHPSTIDDAVKPFVKEKGVPFPIYIVDERDPEVISEVLGLEMNGAVPTTWILDQDGVPVRSWVEEVTAEKLEQVVRPMKEANVAEDLREAANRFQETIRRPRR